MRTHRVDVCIAGGGPAGLLCGLLLARLGIQVLVLEQHHNFDREYRGEVLMPRFHQLFEQLNLLTYIESFPHTRLTSFLMRGKDRVILELPFSDICEKFPYALWMPQPVLLDALHRKAQTFEPFDLWFGASAEKLLFEGDQSTGVLVRQGEECVEVQAKVVIGADGRTSRIRQLGGFEQAFESYDFDLLWFSLPRPQGAEHTVQLLFTGDHSYIVAPKHPDLIQCGLITQPGEFSEFRKQGIASLQAILHQGSPEFQRFANEVQDFKPFFPLQARISQVTEWAKPGLLLIGDAAHTCSPVGAVGVSMAVATAAVAADVVAQACASGDFSARALGAVQQACQADVDHVQRIQQNAHNFIMPKYKIVKVISPFLMTTAARLGLLPRLLRSIVTHDESYPIRPELRLD